MIINIYITLMPVILAGICNMIFVKTSLYKRLYSPIDGGICLKDGYRLFGENKSWGGFFSMVFFSMWERTMWVAGSIPPLRIMWSARPILWDFVRLQSSTATLIIFPWLGIRRRRRGRVVSFMVTMRTVMCRSGMCAQTAGGCVLN